MRSSSGSDLSNFPDIRQLLANPHIVRTLVLGCFAVCCIFLILWCLIGCCCWRGRPVSRSQPKEVVHSIDNTEKLSSLHIPFERTTTGARRVDIPESPRASRPSVVVGLHADAPITIEGGALRRVRIGWRVQIPSGCLGLVWGAESGNLLIAQAHIPPGWHDLSVMAFNTTPDAVELTPEGSPVAYFRIQRTSSFTLVNHTGTSAGRAGRKKTSAAAQATQRILPLTAIRTLLATTIRSMWLAVRRLSTTMSLRVASMFEHK